MEYRCSRTFDVFIACADDPCDFKFFYYVIIWYDTLEQVGIIVEYYFSWYSPNADVKGTSARHVTP